MYMQMIHIFGGISYIKSSGQQGIVDTKGQRMARMTSFSDMWESRSSACRQKIFMGVT